MIILKCGDLVSRDAVTERLDGMRPWDDGSKVPYKQGYNAALLDAIEAIRDSRVLPAADAELTRHGQWIYDNGDEYADHYHCSECENEIDLCSEIYTEPTPHYCPECGAKMDRGNTI